MADTHNEARIAQLEQQLAEANLTITRQATRLLEVGGAAYEASEAMSRIRLVHDTADGARAAWRIAREWQEKHA